MLDISIKALEKSITNQKKAFDFIRKHITVVEKIDGTKLTLIRNDKPFNPKDYTKNWIVAYKGNILYSTEYQGLEGRDEEIKASAIGSSQYKFVHDHLKSVHSGTSAIPKNTEFFIEFVQNKPTVTRDYARKHGMFLVGFGPTKYAESRGQLFSSSNFVDDPKTLEKYRNLLKLGGFPVVFEGNLSSYKEIMKGCIDLDLKDTFSVLLRDVDFSDPLSIVGAAVQAFSQLQSSLGGQAEGVVIQVGAEDVTEKHLFKVLASDQHSKEVRDAKKERYKGTQEEEKIYWEEVNLIVDEILDSTPHGENIDEILKNLSKTVYRLKDLPKHPVRTKINTQEDILLTAKLRLLGTGSHRANKIAVIPMAAKPFHAGHDSLIKKAESDGNNSIIVLVSTGGREKITSEDMIPLWRDVYIPGIRSAYGDKVIIRFSDSPMREAVLIARDLVKRGKETIVRLYGGIDELGSNEAEERVEAALQKNPDLKNKIIAVGVSRSETGGISGTEMRSYIDAGDSASFMNNLPDWIDDEQKLYTWKMMSKISNKVLKSENLIRKYVLSILEA